MSHVGHRSARGETQGAFAAFRTPSFKWHWLSTLASFSGMQMQTIALGILGWQLSHSYAVVGILQAASAIPMALLSLPGGALVDRMEKRRVVALTQAFQGLLGLAIAILVQADLITVVLLFLGGVVQGALFSVNGPARMALLTEVVDADVLPSAVSLQNIAMNSTRVAAPALAGVLISFFSIEAAYYLTAALYAITVATILRVPRSPTTWAAPGPLLAEIGGGLRYVTADRMLRSLMLSALTIALFVLPYQVMLPGFASDTLGREELFGAMVAVSGIGGLMGSFGVATLANHPRKPYIQFILGLVAGGGLIALGALPAVLGAGGAFAAIGVVGASATGYMTLNQTMLMTESVQQFRGRVMSISMLTFSAMPLMSLPLGVVADAIGGDGAFITQGAIVLAVIVVLAVTNRGHTFKSRPAAAREATSESPAGHQHAR